MDPLSIHQSISDHLLVCRVRQINSIQPWYDTLFTVTTVHGLFISLEENVTFTCNFLMTLGNIIMEKPSSSYCRVITEFSIFHPFLPSIISHTSRVEQTNKVLSPVFFLLIKTIKYSENRSRALWPAISSIPNNPQMAPRSATETYAYFRCCHTGLMQGKSAPKAC